MNGPPWWLWAALAFTTGWALRHWAAATWLRLHGQRRKPPKPPAPERPNPPTPAPGHEDTLRQHMRHGRKLMTTDLYEDGAIVVLDHVRRRKAEFQPPADGDDRDWDGWLKGLTR
jgi:hypothetical protein